MTKLTLFYTIGLPASGKDTIAVEMMQKDPQLVRTNKDLIREMLHISKWSTENEKMVLRVRDSIIEDALRVGKNVIVTDTNFGDKHIEKFKELAMKYHADIKCIDLTNVPLDVCLNRDAKREKSVGKKVIMNMYNRYLRKDRPLLLYGDKSLQDIIICDLDGTLAHIHERNPYDSVNCLTDKLNESVSEIIKSICCDTDISIIFLSGRKEEARENTIKWLESNGFSLGYTYIDLFMRQNDDDRPDAIIKEELFNEHIEGKYRVIGIFDDRLKVCRMWYKKGLTVFRVGDPDADF